MIRGKFDMKSNPSENLESINLISRSRVKKTFSKTRESNHSTRNVRKPPPIVDQISKKKKKKKKKFVYSIIPLC